MGRKANELSVHRDGAQTSMKMEKPVNPKDFNKPNRQILGTDQLDDMGMALLSLTREVTVINDRMTLLEHVLEAKGIDVAAELERLEPDAALQKRLDDATQKIVSSVVNTLAGVK